MHSHLDLALNEDQALSNSNDNMFLFLPTLLSTQSNHAIASTVPPLVITSSSGPKTNAIPQQRIQRCRGRWSDKRLKMRGERRQGEGITMQAGGVTIVEGSLPALLPKTFPAARSSPLVSSHTIAIFEVYSLMN